jgi:hypothetical protein
MTPAFLDKTVSSQLNDVHRKYAPDTELWVGEAAAAWHSGAAGVTNRFTSSFWWADALGSLAAANHSTYVGSTACTEAVQPLSTRGSQPPTLHAPPL